MGRWRKESNTEGVLADRQRLKQVAATRKVKRQQNDAVEKQSTDKKATKEAGEANESVSKEKLETIILSSSESDEEVKRPPKKKKKPTKVSVIQSRSEEPSFDEEADAEVLISSKKLLVVGAKNGSAAVTKKKLESSWSSSSDADNKAGASQGKKLWVASLKNVPSVALDKKHESSDVSSESEDEPNINNVEDMSRAEDEDDTSEECSDVGCWKEHPDKPAVAVKTNGNSDEEYSEESEDEHHVKSPKKKLKTSATPSGQKGKRKFRQSLYDYGGIYFRSFVDLKKYHESFIYREVLKGRTVNFDFFDQENLMIGEWISGLGWKKFLMEKNVVYPDLVRQFYTHLDKNMVSHVKGVEINLTQEILGEIMGMDALNVDKEYQNTTKEIMFKDLSGDEVFGTSLQARDMPLPMRLLHKIVVDSILPRMRSKGVITVDDASVMWCAIKGFKVTLPRVILNHMRATLSEKDLALPYGMLITRILEYFKVDLEGELKKKPSRYGFIGEITVKLMGFKKDGVRGWILKNEPPLASSRQAGQEMAEEDAIQGREEMEGNRAERDAEGNRVEEDALHSPHHKLPQKPLCPGQSSLQPDQTQTAPSTCQHKPPIAQPATQATFPSAFTSDLVQLIRSSLDERLTSFESKLMSKIEALDGRIAVIEHGLTTTNPSIQESLKLFEANGDFITKQILAVRTSLTETTKGIKDGLSHLCEKLVQLKDTDAFRPQHFVPVRVTPPHLRKQS